jgi:DNA-binding response OmpR family regulator
MSPIPERPNENPPAGTGCAAARRSHRILLVEDDEAVRRLNSRVLAQSGYAVVAANDGLAGWEAIQADDFDVLVTDHCMPGLTGLELVAKLRAAGRTLPVILASGTIGSEEEARMAWLKVSAALFKPFYPQDLVAAVESVLAGAAAGQSQAEPTLRATHTRAPSPPQT